MGLTPARGHARARALIFAHFANRVALRPAARPITENQLTGNRLPSPPLPPAAEFVSREASSRANDRAIYPRDETP